jgi:small subunit ribosomal protein S1
MRQTEPNPWEELAKQYPIGKRVTCTVKKITDFGIFVGVGGEIDGLIHISDLSWSSKIKHPSELYKNEDQIEAVVTNLDVENERFSLSIKQLSDDPWKKAAKQYSTGNIIKGKITKITDFGLFVEVEESIEGLVHKKDIFEKDEEASHAHKVGEEVEAMVVSVDPEAHKMALSIKAIQNAEERKVLDDYHKGAATATPKLGDLLIDAQNKPSEVK